MLDMQGCWKLLKDGMAIGANVRGHAAADFFRGCEAAEKLQSTVQYFILSDQEGLW